ncbi:MAG: hypothetical protein ACRD6X_13595, partial [Pyrinomonadaceae bacterium]
RIVGGKRLAAKNPCPILIVPPLSRSIGMRACAKERGHSCPQAGLCIGLPGVARIALTHVRACAKERGHSCPQAEFLHLFALRCAFRPY